MEEGFGNGKGSNGEWGDVLGLASIRWEEAAGIVQAKSNVEMG